MEVLVAALDPSTVSVPEARKVAHDHVVAYAGVTCNHRSRVDVRGIPVIDPSEKCFDLVCEIETLTGVLFSRSTLNPMSTVTIGDLATETIRFSVASGLVVSPEVATRVARNHVGAEQVLASHGYRGLLNEIRRTNVDPAVVGVPGLLDVVVEFQDQSDGARFHDDQVQAANSVLRRVDDVLHGVVDPLLRTLEGSVFEQERQRLAFAVGSPVRNVGPILLPGRSELVRLLQRSDVPVVVFDPELAATLLVALDSPSEHFRQPGRGFIGGRLGHHVRTELLAAGRYLQPGSSRTVREFNGRMLSERLEVPVWADDVRVHAPTLLPAVKLPRRPRNQHNDVVSRSRFTDLGEIIRFLVGGSVAPANHLPSVGQLRRHVPGALEDIEAFVHPQHSSYKAFCAWLVEQYPHLSAPVSNNEVLLLKLLDELFGDDPTATVVHDACYRVGPHFEERSFRPDALLTYIPDGVIPGIGAHGAMSVMVEADGEGHFHAVSNWDLERARDNDVAKARAVAATAQSGTSLQLVALHHAVLHDMTAEQLGRVLDVAQQHHAVWMFVRKSGCTDMRAHHAPPTQLKVAGLEHFDVFVITGTC